MKFLRLWLPILIWAGLIFFGSSLPAVRVSPDGLIDFLSHKMVHLVEYSVFYVLLYRALVEGHLVVHRGKVVASFLATFIFALSDEYHQSFIPGRSARGRDTVIDLLGSLLGVFLWKYSVTVRRKPLL